MRFIPLKDGSGKYKDTKTGQVGYITRGKGGGWYLAHNRTEYQINKKEYEKEKAIKDYTKYESEQNWQKYKEKTKSYLTYKNTIRDNKEYTGNINDLKGKHIRKSLNELKKEAKEKLNSYKETRDVSGEKQYFKNQKELEEKYESDLRFYEDFSYGLEQEFGVKMGKPDISDYKVRAKEPKNQKSLYEMEDNDIPSNYIEGYDGYKGTPYERKYNNTAEVMKDPNSKLNQYINKEAVKKAEKTGNFSKMTKRQLAEYIADKQIERGVITQDKREVVINGRLKGIGSAKPMSKNELIRGAESMASKEVQEIIDKFRKRKR